MRLRLGSFLLSALLVLSATRASAAPVQVGTAHAVISTYYSTLNAAMKSGDVSQVTGAYGPDAVLTQSNALGVTKVYRGRVAIAGFYQGLYTKFPGLHFTLAGSQRDLSASILFRYEQASTPAMTVPARCAHLFTVSNGLIATDDWVTYFPGK
jgi:hypothetical protein